MAFDMQRSLRTSRIPLHIVVCADGGATSRGAFDEALRFCKAGDTLSVLHVDVPAPGQEAFEAMTRRYWTDECEKVSFSRGGLAVEFVPAPLGGRSIVDVILKFLEARRSHLCVLGSVQLMATRDGDVLGSVAQAVARRTKTSCCIVKNYGHGEAL